MADKISSLNFTLNTRWSSEKPQQQKNENSFNKDLFITRMNNLDISKETSEQLWNRLNELA